MGTGRGKDRSGRSSASRRCLAARRIAGVLFGAALLVLCLKLLTDIVERKDSDIKYKPFFAETKDFDVLYFGSSHVLDGFYPMELWEEYGITSYNFGGHGNYIPTTYWVMENALDYTTPKVALIDCFFITPNYKMYYQNSSFAHFSLDAFPLTPTKIRAAFDLTNDERLRADAREGIIDAGNDREARDPIAFLWDFSVYHNRWSDLNESDFQVVPWRTKGSETNVNVADPDEEYYIPLPEKFEEETVAKAYLRKIIADCQKRGIEVVLTYLPHLADEGDWRAANCIYDIAREYGVEYLDFLYMDVVDYQTDMSDSYAHLNASGAKKVTKYLGNYLQETFGLESHKEDPAYANWLADEADYLNYKGEKFPVCNEFRDYLMLLGDQDFDALIDVELFRFWEDARYMALLHNMGLKETQLPEDARFLAVHAGQEVTVVRQEELDADEGADTVLGKLRVTEQDGETRVFLDDGEVLTWENARREGKRIDVCVLKNGRADADVNGALVDRVSFLLKSAKTDGVLKVSTKDTERIDENQ